MWDLRVYGLRAGGEGMQGPMTPRVWDEDVGDGDGDYRRTGKREERDTDA